tara:strand:- start:70090 stop:70323 length:234 start_codon:yes stop_codon:yes gene_type:complete
MDWSDAAVTNNCQKEVDLGEYVEMSRCVEETLRSGVGFGTLMMFSSALFGFLALATGSVWVFLLRRNANVSDGKQTS